MVQMDASLLLYDVRQGGFLLSSCALLALFSFVVSCFCRCEPECEVGWDGLGCLCFIAFFTFPSCFYLYDASIGKCISWCLLLSYHRESYWPVLHREVSSCQTMKRKKEFGESAWTVAA